MTRDDDELEQHLELRKDLGFDHAVRPIKKTHDGPSPGWPLVSELYIQAKLAVHLHFRTKPGSGAFIDSPGDYCAYFYGTCGRQ